MENIIKIEKESVEQEMLFDVGSWLTLDVDSHWMQIDIGCCLTLDVV